jgi:asparagine synthase (glutamine-hydrolysing)
MTRSLAHRGPDAEGVWHDKLDRCSLGHRRLSIIDTSEAGKQPMLSASGRWVVSFNGELYNFQELRAQLQAAGVAFRGRTDTEVLLNAIDFWGIDALSKFEGMFAFAAFDCASGQLILARDPFGEKPLYYAEMSGGGIAFASELQALELVPSVDLSVSPDSVAELLMFQYIGAPRTIYRSVKKLPPGHWLVCYPGQEPRLGSYFRFEPGLAGFDSRPIGDLADELEAILVRSLRRRLISDVPLGAFLSGGVDSSTVCALITKRLGVPLKTFSIGFDGAPESEHQAARAFATHLGTDHHEKILTPNASDFLLHIGQVLDEPNGDSSCLPTYLLSQFARESVTVALSGDGGDEMFVGYGRYFSTLDDAHQADAKGSRWSAGDAYYSNRILVSVEEHVRELFGDVPRGAESHLARLRADVSTSHPLFCALRATDVENYMPGAVLPKVDRMSMQHSLEVRTPFLNVELARFAERLPVDALYDGKYGKRVLREIAYRYLPRGLVDLPKQGFGLPMSQWAKTSLLAVAGQLLEAEDSRLAAWLGRDSVSRFMARQRSQNGFAAYQVWTLAMLESWLRSHPARTPRQSAPAHVIAAPPASAVHAPKPKTEAIPGLVLWPVGQNTFLVAQGPASLLEEPGLDRRSFSLMSEAAHLLKVFNHPLQPGISEQRIEGESWGAIAAAESRSTKGALLEGATLLCADHGLWGSITRGELEQLRRVGVACMVSRHPHKGDGSIFVLHLQRKQDRRQEFLDVLRLAAAAKGRRWLSRAALSEGYLRLAGPLPGIEVAEAELSHRYMLFDGLQQMPPIPATHDEIRQAGGGRYSIWSGHAFYSKIAQRFNWIWCVELNDKTRRLLPYVPELRAQISAPVLHSFVDDLRTFIAAQEVAAGEPPRPGDKLVVLTHALPPGGAERQWCYLAIDLKRRGFDVEFVTLFPLEGQNIHYLPLLEQAGIRVTRLDEQPPIDAIRFLPAAARANELATHLANPFGFRLVELTALLHRLKPAAVFAQLDYSNLAAATAALIADVPRVVLSFRNYNPSNFSYLANNWFQPLYAALATSKRVVLTGNSRAANADYANWIGIPESDVTLVPNAISAESFVPSALEGLDALRAELRVEADEPIVLGVFRLSEEKRPLLFAESIARIAREIPNVRAFIAGVGPHEHKLKDRIRELGIEARLTLLGRRDDVFKLMTVSSVLLLTSSFEGMPNVLMEAQLAGIPVVAPRVGGVPDCVLDGETGFIVDLDDHIGYADACVRVLRDEPLRQRMGNAGRLYMREAFSIEAMAARYLNVLAEEAAIVKAESAT